MWPPAERAVQHQPRLRVERDQVAVRRCGGHPREAPQQPPARAMPERLRIPGIDHVIPPVLPRRAGIDADGRQRQALPGHAVEQVRPAQRVVQPTDQRHAPAEPRQAVADIRLADHQRPGIQRKAEAARIPRRRRRPLQRLPERIAGEQPHPQPQRPRRLHRHHRPRPLVGKRRPAARQVVRHDVAVGEIGIHQRRRRRVLVEILVDPELPELHVHRVMRRLPAQIGIAQPRPARRLLIGEPAQALHVMARRSAPLHQPGRDIGRKPRNPGIPPQRHPRRQRHQRGDRGALPRPAAQHVRGHHLLHRAQRDAPPREIAPHPAPVAEQVLARPDRPLRRRRARHETGQHGKAQGGGANTIRHDGEFPPSGRSRNPSARARHLTKPCARRHRTVPKPSP